MDRLPLFFDLRGRTVLLLGDGPAADAKRRLIEGTGGRVVREPEADTRLAFVALDGEAADSETARLKARGLLINAVDRPDLCDFLVPAIVDRSPVVVAIGTGGTSASLAKTLRERLETLLPATIGRLAEAIFASRAKVAAAVPTVEGRRHFWAALMALGAPLDPLRAADNPGAAIGSALIAPPELESSLTTIDLTSADPDDLTLRQLRALSQADTIFFTPAAPAAILDRARRDAARVPCSSPPSDPPRGCNVFVDHPAL